MDHQPRRPTRQLDRRSLIAGSAAASLATFAGCLPSPDTLGEQRFRVGGPSMLPSLRPDHRRGECPICRVVLSVPARESELVGGTFQCWHCGADVPNLTGVVIPGDVVMVSRAGDHGRPTAGATSFAAGQLVGFSHDGQTRVKRLVALPGSLIDTSDGRLTVDGERIEDHDDWSIPTLPVDFDQLRRTSRWSPSAESNHWQRSDRNWQHPGGAPSAWLVYNHQNVYRHDQTDLVRDDYPNNIWVQRRMQRVDRLQLLVEIESTSPGRIEFLQWRPDQVYGSSVDVAGRQHVALAAGMAVDVEAGVTASSPLAIRLIGGRSWRLHQLAIVRRVEYRLLSRHDRASYPLRLRPEQCFVLGDNVPVSIDSRDWGPIPLASLIGPASLD